MCRSCGPSYCAVHAVRKKQSFVQDWVAVAGVEVTTIGVKRKSNASLELFVKT